MKDQIGVLLGFIILTATLAVVALYGINHFSALREKGISAEVDFQCAQTYRYSQMLPDGAVASYPMEEEYDDCLQAKGNLN